MVRKKRPKTKFFKSLKSKKFLVVFILLWLLLAVYETSKPLPEGISVEGKINHISEHDIDFLFDTTFLDKNGERQSNQEIFDSIFEIISNAEEFILVDMFLFNPYLGNSKESYRSLSSELVNALINKKKKYGDIEIIFITDEINHVYGGFLSEQIKRLENEGIDVIITDNAKLRDSNFLYSSAWRLLFQWFGNSEKYGILQNPFISGKNKVTFRTYLKLFNFKANHRKVILADDGSGNYESIITSANPHDGSSAHTNVAFKVRNGPAGDIYESERAVAEFSGFKMKKREFENIDNGDVSIQLITEGKIKKSILEEIDKSAEGDKIDIMMFYLSDRKIIKSLLKASERNVEIRIILDPNRDAFGHEKNGIPNRQVAYDLVRKGNGNIKVRWYETHGEQNHAKIIIIKKENSTIIILGSANLTRRNIDDLNLETNVKVIFGNGSEIVADIDNFFNLVWENKDGNLYTVDYGNYKETSRLKYVIYYLMETLGLSSF
jgi:phosphatidylserine/phosphatidylglycerophosphate/cardiolipin synthase-like enzyme